MPVPTFQCYYKYSQQGEARIHLHHFWPPEKLIQEGHYTSLAVCLPANCSKKSYLNNEETKSLECFINTHKEQPGKIQKLQQWTAG